MKKQFFAISLLLATNAQTIDSLKMLGGAAGLAAVVGLSEASKWDKQIKEKKLIVTQVGENTTETLINKNSDGVCTVIGKPFGITGRDMLSIINTATILTAAGTLTPNTLGSTAVTSGGMGAATLAVQILFGKHDQEKNPVDVNTTIKYTGAGAVLGTTYQHVPFINSFINGVFGWNK